jgi:phage terminase small subunit
MITLPDRQQRFCEEYVIDLNATQAAARAGYSKKTANEQACRLLANVSIQAKISELQEKISNKLSIDAQWVMQRFKDISDRCVQAEPVLLKDGTPTGEYQFDSAGANKATEMLGKMIGAFEVDNAQKKATLRIGFDD